MGEGKADELPNKIRSCINQVFTPNLDELRPSGLIPIDGRGDCRTCVPDEKNRECPGYRPITLYSVRVK